MKLQIKRKGTYNGKAIESEPLDIDLTRLENWLLGRVLIPSFDDIEDMKKFITGINLLIEPISGGVYGPVDYFYDKDLCAIDSLGNIDITLDNGNQVNLEVQKYSMWDDNQPTGNVTLRDYLQEEKDQTIPLNVYSSYSPSNKLESGLYEYSSICVDYLVPFISIYHLEQLGKAQLDWYDSETKSLIDHIDDDFEEYWVFI